MRELTINVDSDNVVYWWIPIMAATVKRLTGRACTATPKVYACYEEWGITLEEFLTTLEDYAYMLFSVGSPVLGSVEALHKIIDEGHRVRIVTDKMLRTSAATREAHNATADWYASHDLLHRVEMVYSDKKREYPADIVIDDKPSLKWAQDGAVNVVFNQSWNQDDQIPDGTPSFLRVSDWDEIQHLVHAVSNAPVVR